MHWTEYKKAVNVAILALIALVASWIVSGAFDMDQVKIIAAGLVTSLTVFFTTNTEPEEVTVTGRVITPASPLFDQNA